MSLGLHRPIGVFDAGIGSCAVAQLIRERYPAQDIIYLADRASFPYGAKNRAELLAVVNAAAQYLARAGAAAIVLASNAPSVMLLHELRGRLGVPMVGVFPPVAQALAISESKHVAVLGVLSLASSPEIQSYIRRESGQGRVEVVNASPLVDLVESGAFLSRPQATTQASVSAFVDALRERCAGVDVCTLSSTHLPWLAPFFQQAARDIVFLDPAAQLVAQLAAHTSTGGGRTICLATESAENPLRGLKDMLKALGVALEPHLIRIDKE